MIKKLLEYSPALYVALILLGYLHIQGYYSFFDIDIYNYIALSEVILLFMPIIVQVMLILLVLFFLVIIGRNEKSGSNDFETVRYYFKEIFINHSWTSKRGIHKKLLSFFWDLFALVMRVGANLVMLYLSFILLKAIYLKQSVIYEYYGATVIMIIFVYGYYLPILDYIIKHIFKNLNKTEFIYGYRIIIIRFIIAYFILSIYSNFTHSLAILQGRPYESFKAKYDNGEISTNDTLVYIGGTQNFVFLRNLQDSSNVILRVENLSLYEIKKINRARVMNKDSSTVKSGP